MKCQIATEEYSIIYFVFVCTASVLNIIINVTYQEIYIREVDFGFDDLTCRFFGGVPSNLSTY